MHYYTALGVIEVTKILNILLTIIPRVVRLSWLESAYSHPFFPRAIFTCKVGQTDLVFGTWSGFIRSSSGQDYKSLCAAVTMCVTMINTRQTDRQHFDQLIQIAQPAELKPSKTGTFFSRNRFTQVG